MRVLTVHNYYQKAGGEDVVFSAETALLLQHGHEVVEYTENNMNINGMNKLRVAVQTIWSRPSMRKLFGNLRARKFDVAHFHNTFLLVSPSAYYSCREVGVPVVQTLQNYRLLCPSATLFREGRACEDCLGKTLPWPGIRHACYRASRAQTAVVTAMLTVHSWLKTWQKQVDLYIALTEFGRRKFVEGGLPADKIVVKPNIVYPDPGVRIDQGNYAVFVGRLSPEKGLRTLVHAWRNVKDIPLVIAGDGPLRQEIQRLIYESAQEGSIELLGHRSREEVLGLMKQARFIVFPSEWYEGFPVTILESFACGVPVIASGLGAMAEIVEDGRTGLHFIPGDPEDLATKVEWAWDHPVQMQKMGHEARAEYEAKYTAERNYKRLMEIYEMAISRQKHRLAGATA